MIRLQFLGNLPVGVFLAIVASAAMWLIYRRQSKQILLGWQGWGLPALRSLAVFLIVLMLTEPLAEYFALQGAATQLTFILDDSRSMSVSDISLSDAFSTANLPATGVNPSDSSRYAQAARQLLGDQGMLDQLIQDFDTRVVRASASPEDHVLFESQMASSTPIIAGLADRSWAEWLPSEWASRTRLGEALLRHGLTALGGTREAPRAVVLMSDGQSNAGDDPLQVAESLRQADIPVFTIGYGPTSPPPDLAVIDVTYPDSVLPQQMLHGKLIVREILPNGTAYQAQLLHGENVLWRASLVSTGQTRKEIEFAFPAQQLHAAQQQPRGSMYRVRAPIELKAQLITSAPEICLENNERRLHTNVVIERSRVLLIDGRSRWEARYLKNLFAREPTWDIDMAIESITDSSQPADLERLLSNQAQLMEYELVILGDVPGHAFSPQQLEWLVAFVELGGGLIVVDGAHGNLRDSAYQTLGPVLPIRWTDRAPPESIRNSIQLEKSMELTPAGMTLDALRLTSPPPPATEAAKPIADSTNPAAQSAENAVAWASDAANQAVWQSLPNVEFVSDIEPAIGSETLVNAVSSIEAQPLLVTRRYGAGRVLFVATDETWRWRYKLADQIHQRLWIQLARWVRREPYCVRNAFVSLDCGPARVAQEDIVEIRAQLRDVDEQPAEHRSVVAVIESESGLVTRLPLVERPDLPGSYGATTGKLPAGVYHVTLEAEGFSRDALDLHCQFVVADSAEDELVRLECDVAKLQQVAQLTGGRYLAADALDRLPDLLQPLARGRMVRTTAVLWQSPAWFGVVIALLVAEWLVRKRAGLP